LHILIYICNLLLLLITTSINLLSSKMSLMLKQYVRIFIKTKFAINYEILQGKKENKQKSISNTPTNHIEDQGISGFSLNIDH